MKRAVHEERIDLSMAMQKIQAYVNPDYIGEWDNKSADGKEAYKTAYLQVKEAKIYTVDQEGKVDYSNPHMVENVTVTFPREAQETIAEKLAGANGIDANFDPRFAKKTTFTTKEGEDKAGLTVSLKADQTYPTRRTKGPILYINENIKKDVNGQEYTTILVQTSPETRTDKDLGIEVAVPKEERTADSVILSGDALKQFLEEGYKVGDKISLVGSPSKSVDKDGKEFINNFARKLFKKPNADFRKVREPDATKTQTKEVSQ